jgi:hypothetical protein
MLLLMVRVLFKDIVNSKGNPDNRINAILNEKGKNDDNVDNDSVHSHEGDDDSVENHNDDDSTSDSNDSDSVISSQGSDTDSINSDSSGSNDWNKNKRRALHDKRRGKTSSNDRKKRRKSGSRKHSGPKELFQSSGSYASFRPMESPLTGVAQAAPPQLVWEITKGGPTLVSAVQTWFELYYSYRAMGGVGHPWDL